MASYSKIELLGYIGNDPESISAASGEGAKFSLAVNRVWTDDTGQKRQETDWFQIVTWGKLAENCLSYLSKGRQVFVTGRPQMSKWEDDHGQKQERLQVVANRVIFLGNPEPEPQPEPESEDEIPF